MNICKNPDCGNRTKNKKFCSRSCSNAYNNKKNPKRKKTKICKSCDSKIISQRTYCDSCWDKLQEDKTLVDSTYVHLHRSSAYSAVRTRARAIMKDKPQVCHNCGYDKHVEVCHIKAISTYPKETLLSEINKESNLILLCPNCHWELDHSLLTLS